MFCFGKDAWSGLRESYPADQRGFGAVDVVFFGFKVPLAALAHSAASFSGQLGSCRRALFSARRAL